MKIENYMVLKSVNFSCLIRPLKKVICQSGHAELEHNINTDHNPANQNLNQELNLAKQNVNVEPKVKSHPQHNK